MIPFRDFDVDCLQAISGLIGRVGWRLAAKMPPDSWPATLLREAACMVSGESAYTREELLRLLGARDVGPVGYWVSAEALGLAGLEEAQRSFAREALRESNPSGLQKEISLFRRPGFLPARLLAALGRAVKAMDDATAASIRRGAELSDDPAEKDFVRRIELARKEEDPLDAGAGCLEAAWAWGLEAFVRARCEELRG